MLGTLKKVCCGGGGGWVVEADFSVKLEPQAEQNVKIALQCTMARSQPQYDS